MELLPSTTYQAPSRARGRRLNTILEAEEHNSHAFRSDSEGDESDRTIIGRPAGLDAKLSSVPDRRRKISNSPIRQDTSRSSSPCSSIGDNTHPSRGARHSSLRYSYSESDAGTVFSEDDDCPSLTGSNASEPTTIYTESNRNSVMSSRSTRRQYPSILIPRDSWHAMDSPVKEINLPMSPARKILLSPQALSQVPDFNPAPEGPPSLADASSSASMSPCVAAMSSVPPTPDLDNLEPSEGQAWGTPHHLPESIEIAFDEEHSIIISPREPNSAHSSFRESSGYGSDWNDMMIRFPAIPGATPVEYTPVSPNIDALRGFNNVPTDRGVQLPTDAMQLLSSLTHHYNPDEILSEVSSNYSRAKAEMVERGPSVRKERAEEEPQSAAGFSEYSFSQLSIPSPGGFFSSLQGGARNTWSAPRQQSTPSSAIAENFYTKASWDSKPDNITQRVIEVPEPAVTDGPPTAIYTALRTPKPVRFDSSGTDTDASSETVTARDHEDEDLYGPPPTNIFDFTPSTELRHEYEETYEAGIKQAAEANIDRTSDWLSAQDAYLSALRETNPLNDPADYPPTPHPGDDEENEQATAQLETQKAAQFLEEASKTVKIAEGITPVSEKSSNKEGLFLEAFSHHHHRARKGDAFLQSAPRLDCINSHRLALPTFHIQTLLNNLTSASLCGLERPKYRGPYHQNPRATGNFNKGDEFFQYAEAERKQNTMDHVQSSIWTTEALRKVLYNDRLMSCADVANRMDSAASAFLSSSESQSKKSVRILDLAGAATASWAWSAAIQWPHAKVFTVQTKAQTEAVAKLNVNKVAQKGQDSIALRPENPSNHRVVTAPSFWQLPFADNFFDVISTRSLHMFLKSKPVPGVDSIDEWDLTLKECMRVLKPGGVLDFFVLDPTVTEEKSKHQRNISRASTLNSVDTSFGGSNAASISPSNAVGQQASVSSFNLPLQPVSRSEAVVNSFGTELKRRGFEQDGGCGKLMGRLKKEGFVNVKRQWVALPMGRAGPTHTDPASVEDGRTVVTNKMGVDCLKTPMTSEFNKEVIAKAGPSSKVNSLNSTYSWYFDSDGTRRKAAFPLAPRPLSEVSTVSHIIDPYSNVEAVQGPIGSTAEVADMAGLVGGMMWEEWLIRLRIEMGVTEPIKLLEGVSEVFSEGWMKGACWKGIIGWAKKPRVSSKSDKVIAAQAQQAKLVKARQSTNTFDCQSMLPRNPAGRRYPATAGAGCTPADNRRLSQQRGKLQLSLTLDTKNIKTALRSAPLPVITENIRRDQYQRPAIAEAPKQVHISPIDSAAVKSPDSLEDFTRSAVDRGEICTITTMMIIE